MALKNLGLVIFIELLRANRQMAREYEEAKDGILDDVLSGSVLIGSADMRKRLEGEFAEIFNKYFVAGFDGSRTLVNKEVAIIADSLKVPWRYNKDVIDLVNEQSVFKGFADQLYKEKFSRQEIDRLKRVLLSSTYSNADEKVLRDELQKSFNLTKRRAQLLARGETKRLRETTKIIYHNQREVADKFELVWDAVVDEATRPGHLELDGSIRQADGYFYSPTFGKVKAPPIAYNCRCTTYFRRI